MEHENGNGTMEVHPKNFCSYACFSKTTFAMYDLCFCRVFLGYSSNVSRTNGWQRCEQLNDFSKQPLRYHFAENTRGKTNYKRQIRRKHSDLGKGRVTQVVIVKSRAVSWVYVPFKN